MSTGTSKCNFADATKVEISKCNLLGSRWVLNPVLSFLNRDRTKGHSGGGKTDGEEEGREK